MRLKNLTLIFAALATVFVLAACGSSGQSTGDQGNAADQENMQGREAQKKQVAPKQGPQESGGGVAAVEAPSDDMMKLTVPQMKRIRNAEIPTGLGTDETLFHDYAAVHLKHTGFPWEEEANVYIAGHRLGYRSEEHTSELQSRQYLVCRLLLEKKKVIEVKEKKLTELDDN